MTRTIILVGHGGVPRDFPRDKVRRLMQLESQRASSQAPASEEERALDREIREHPRDQHNDPYKFGLEQLAAALRERVPDPVLVAYNEFCAPSVEAAVAHAIRERATEIVLVSSMMTPGGSHASEEIPALVRQLQQRHPEVTLRYAWPFDLGQLSDFIAAHLRRHEL